MLQLLGGTTPEVVVPVPQLVARESSRPWRG
jgi:hypothetical protein